VIYTHHVNWQVSYSAIYKYVYVFEHCSSLMLALVISWQ
jgi:hypothetical protein